MAVFLPAYKPASLHTTQYSVHQRNQQPVQTPLTFLQILSKHFSDFGDSRVLMVHPLPASSHASNIHVPHCVTLSYVKRKRIYSESELQKSH